MFDFRCSAVWSRICAQQQQLPSVRPLPLATMKFYVRELVWRRELVRANTNSRRLLQELCLVWRQTPRESALGTLRGNLHQLKSRYVRVG